MKCPKCRTEDLGPTKLEENLPAMGCTGCDGALISLLYYRDWAERTTLPSEIVVSELSVVEEKDTKVALTCPKCTRLMTKYGIASEVGNRLDVCASCDEAWIDDGEWTLLKSLALSKDLSAIFTTAWQKRIKAENTERQRYERLESAVGTEDAERAHEVRVWLHNKPSKPTIIQYIGFE